MSNESTRDALYARYVKFANSKGYVRTKAEYFERFETFKAHIVTCLGTRQSPVNWKGLTKITGSVSTSSMLNAALLELIEEGEVTRLEQPDADDLFCSTAVASKQDFLKLLTEASTMLDKIASIWCDIIDDVEKNREARQAMNPCLQKAEPNEPIFVLLGRDPATPAAISAWARERVIRHKNLWEDEQIQSAMVLCNQLAKQRYKPKGKDNATY